MTSDQQVRIWIKFKGKAVKAHKIEVLRLGDFLSNFQRLLIEYGRVKKIRKPQEHLKLYLTKVEPGTITLVLEPAKSYSYHYTDPINSALDFILNLLNYVDDYQKLKQYLEQELKSPEVILSNLKRLETLWSEEELKVGIARKPTKPKDEEYIYIPAEKKQIIQKLIDEYIKEISDKIQGAIVELKAHGKKRHFEIITTTGEKVLCYYDPEEDPEIEIKAYKYFWKPVEVIGIIKQKGRIKKIEKTLDLNLYQTEITGKFGGYKIKKPIPLKVEYDHNTDVWCVENKDLELYGCGKTLDEALKDAEVVFGALVEGYALEDDKELDEGAKKLKRKLLEYVEVSQ